MAPHTESIESLVVDVLDFRPVSRCMHDCRVRIRCGKVVLQNIVAGQDGTSLLILPFRSNSMKTLVDDCAILGRPDCPLQRSIIEAVGRIEAATRCIAMRL